MLIWGLILGWQKYNQHLGGNNAGVLDFTLRIGTEMDRVALFQNILFTVCVDGHLALDYVVNRLQRIGTLVNAAAGQEMGQPANQLPLVYVLWVVQSCCPAVVVTGCRIGVCFICLCYLIAHDNTSFLAFKLMYILF